MKYYAYLKQHGEGCDYTIGCGSKIESFDANSDSEASDKLKEIVKEHRGDYELETALLFKDPISLDVKSIYQELKDSNDKENKRLQDAKDLAEYERLKNKFN